MKKTTRKAALLLLLLGGMLCQAQSVPDIQKTLQTARLQIQPGSKTFNPEAAISSFKRLAELGNAEAMNALGIIYNQGISVAENRKEGAYWLERSGEKGYARAWYNLGLVYKKEGNDADNAKALLYFEKAAKGGYLPAYKNWGGMVMKGEGISQNYPLALQIFKEGSDKKDSGSTYSLGYMYYKGLGCSQDYTQAVALFEFSAQQGNFAAMYMLGLCYRNGYGVTIDTEKAKYWLGGSASLGFKKSQIELEQPDAENAEPHQNKTLSKAIVELPQITQTKIPETFQKVKQAPLITNAGGNYTGYLLRYDWSGQNIISKTPLQINLVQDNKKLKGQWKEQDADSVAFTADIQENAIVFQDSKIDRTEHFYKDTTNTYAFKEAKLQLLQSEGSSFIVGNLELFNIKEREKERPMYLILEKKQQSTDSSNEVLSSVIIYPNPVVSEFNLSFQLSQPVDVTMGIYTITGYQLHNEQWKNTQAGAQSKTISFNAQPGYYLLRLTYGNQTKNTILIKK
jgi:TPR repeat protein